MAGRRNKSEITQRDTQSEGRERHRRRLEESGRGRIVGWLENGWMTVVGWMDEGRFEDGGWRVGWLNM